MIPPGFSITPPAEPVTQEQVLAAVGRELATTIKSKHGDSTNQSTRFLSLLQVDSATEGRHYRYAMQVDSGPLELQLQCAPRFSQFASLRKRLLAVFKSCPHAETRRHSLAKSLATLSLPKSRATACCAGCALVRSSLEHEAFPHKALFASNAVQDVAARAPQLASFLSAAVRCLENWRGCALNKQSYAAVLGEFLGVDLQSQLLLRDGNECAVDKREDRVSTENSDDDDSETERESR